MAMLKALVYPWLLLLMLLLLSLFVSMSTAYNAFGCGCDEEGYWSVENILDWQKACDFLIAIAYFSIPLELIYFVSCSTFPFKWVLVQFILFIVLCGMTHLLNGWTYGPHTFQLMLSLTIFKFLTALVSFATAITLFTLIPQLLKVKVREIMLRKKTGDLDREVLTIKKQKEAGMRVRMLTREIRKYLDRHTIFYTTLVELSKVLDLENCVVWMPNSGRTEINLTHDLREKSLPNTYNSVIPTSEPDVRRVKGSERVKILDPDSPLSLASSREVGEPGCVAAIRMPILRVSHFKNGTPKMVKACYAILVLVLPSGQGRTWSKQELEMVEVVADQVAVALSHAAVVEEALSLTETLEEKKRALQQASRNAMMASQARCEFKKVMSNGLRRPMHSILGLLSMLQDEPLSDEQLLLVGTTFKAGNVLSRLINDVMDTAGKDYSRFPLHMRPFELHSMIKEAACLFKCMCALRGYKFSIEVDNSMPKYVIGDETRVFQVILHMIGNLLNASRGGGFLLLRVHSASGSQVWNDQRRVRWRLNSSDRYAYVRLEAGIRHTNSDSQSGNSSVIQYSGQRCSGGGKEIMSFDMCKKIVQIMQGDIWMVPNPEGFHQSMVLVLQFQARASFAVDILEQEQYIKRVQSNSVFKGLQILLADADAGNRAVTRRLLEKLGCIVTAVSSGSECLRAVGPSVPPFQVVLLDIHLPDLDGFEVAEELRKDKSRDWLLIVAFTASDDEETRAKCLEVGMDGVLAKPGSSRDLARELECILLRPSRLYT
ncbi:ethylene receptor 2-like [Salvia splendens]|uniref:ethylene receptor 2-like n=1 Tax=Salvia splendens TaxID=180675 RepID=UPI001C252789|nr:ethylene receptor 2-like [Salvia splendens]XP_042029664.1 ethylene receptor 2-like [Salvia splendens]